MRNIRKLRCIPSCDGYHAERGVPQAGCPRIQASISEGPAKTCAWAMSRILMCVSEAPYGPVNGYRLQVSALLDRLSKSHDVVVVGVRGNDQAPDNGDDDRLRLLSPFGGGAADKAASWAEARLHGTPMRVAALSRIMREPVKEQLERFKPDIVHVASPGRLAWLAELLGPTPGILAALDAWHLNIEARAQGSNGLKRKMLEAEVLRVRRFIRRWHHHFALVTVVSEADKRELIAVDQRLRVAVVPNGVDTAAYSENGTRDEGRLIFHGVMNYAPNEAAAEFLVKSVMPLIQPACPNVHLSIVGRSPSEKVRRLAAYPGVEVTGEVPEMRPWLSRSSVAVCPMINGTGIRNKLLEAMANSLPCVTTPLALQGIDAEPGRHLLVASDALGISEKVVQVLRDQKYAREVGRAGHDFVRIHHNWDTVVQSYERIYAEAVSESTRNQATAESSLPKPAETDPDSQENL